MGSGFKGSRFWGPGPYDPKGCYLEVSWMVISAVRSRVTVIVTHIRDF